MAVTAKWYGRSLEGQYGATAARRIDFANDDIRTSLHTVTYVPDQDADDFWDNATNEITGTGYTTLGYDYASLTVTYNTGTNETRLDGEDAAWTSSSFTARIAVTYKNTGVASTSPLMGYVDFGGDETVSSGTFTIQWDATGILKITAT